jgi:hypothetical protein
MKKHCLRGMSIRRSASTAARLTSNIRRSLADGFYGLRNYVKWIANNYPNTRGELNALLQMEIMSCFTATIRALGEGTATPSSTFSDSSHPENFAE